MYMLRWCVPGATVALAVAVMLWGADTTKVNQDRLWQYRNLGKAFYENPTTQTQAVEEFKKALDLDPNSARERVNYGLALLRAGKTAEGVAELEKAQKQDPSIPHTWFNLGIAFKKDGDYEKALHEFQEMVKLVPDEPVSHYNLGVLWKLLGNRPEAVRQFEIASRLNPNLAGPHFQLYNAYRQAGRAEDARKQLAEFEHIKKLTAGAAVPEDMEWSYYAEIYETVEPRAGAAPAVPVKFDDRTLAGSYDAATAGVTALDLDGDGRPGMIAWSANGIRVFRNGTSLVAQPALDELRGVVSVAAGDFDNDGFTDLCVVTRSGAALYRNRKGVFEKDTAALPDGRFEKAVWLDYDHDYDLDLFLLGENAVLVRNNGAAGFAVEPFPFVAGHAIDATPILLIADNKGMDLAVSYADRTGVLYRDRLLGTFTAEPIDALPAGARGLATQDLDNDHWLDLAAQGMILRNRHGTLERHDVAGGPAVFADVENRGAADLLAGGALYRNEGLLRFTKSDVSLPPVAAAAAADFDGDGHIDIADISRDGHLHLLQNRTETKNHWVAVKLDGIKNLKLAPDALVEIKSGASYQEALYRGYTMKFGLDGYGKVDAVRITWPNGLIQNEPKQPIDQAVTYKEAQRLSGSCPMIFTWNGRGFQFITDVLGVAPLGASAGDGRYFPVDHDEYIQIPGTALEARDGAYEVRITEELHEVSYLDQVKLIALDHPSGMEIFTNDKFKAPPFPEFRLFGARRRVYPRAAHDSAGRDVLARLVARDRKYPDGFRRDAAGMAETHHLDLDFGSAAADNRAVLVLNGWVDWADGSTFRNAAQSRHDLELPSLQVKDASGHWRTVVPDMGIPSGKPKTIAVDLTGKFLSASREVRIVTNLCVYWDEIFLSEDSGPPPAQLAPLAPLSSDLHFRGFSHPVIAADRKQPEAFLYDQWMPVSMWNPTPGMYTRYGDVLPLTRSVDDEMAIMGSGDELTLRFQVPAPVRPGWQRDFLLLVDGWAKDGDANTAFSQTVEPLPFHGMSAYPYPSGERYPDDREHREYRRHYNTRPALRLIRPLVSQVRWRE